MDYLSIAIGGTAVMVGAGYLLKRRYKKENSRMLDNTLNFFEDSVRLSEKEFPTIEENKLEKDVRN